MVPWQEGEQQLAHELRQQSLAQLRQMSSREIVRMVKTIGGHYGTEWDGQASQGTEATEAKKTEQEEVGPWGS